MNRENALRIEGLTKTFHLRQGRVEALRGLDMRVPAGSICGLIGANGAGKTTTLRVLLGMARADQGTVEVFGCDALHPVENQRIRSRVAFVPEKKELFPYMSAADVLRFTAAFYPGWNQSLADEYMRRFEIPPHRKIPALSKGMLAKLHLVMALARGAELLILDEPTDGLDALASEEALQAIVSLAAETGTTVLMCSHRLEEIEQVADYLCLIHRGQRLMEGDLEEIRANTKLMRFTLEATPEQAAQLSRYGILKQAGSSHSLLVENRLPEVLRVLKDLEARDLETLPVPLRELYLEKVKHHA